MTDTQAQEALRLADWLRGAVATYPQVSECEPGGYFSELDQRIDEAAALLRSQAARIAELESRVHTCGPTCSKAGCINRRLTAERDALRAELARMREPLSAEHRAAVGVCMTVGHVSVATVQRNLRIGWNRARDILVDLVQRGVLDGLPLSAEFDGITQTGGGV